MSKYTAAQIKNSKYACVGCRKQEPSHDNQPRVTA